MRKLLAANFSRLWKDRAFWCILAAIIGVTLVSVYNNARACDAMAKSGYILTLDDYYFNQLPLLGVAFGLFASLFLGTEYSDGTMRNKLIVGHGRKQIFLGNYLVCATAALLFLAAWLAVNALGFYLIGPMEMGVSGFLMYAAAAVCVTLSFTALFTMIGCLSSNKVRTIIIIAVAFVLLASAAGELDSKLKQPEFHEGMTYVDGEFVMQGPEPNPFYLSGTARTVCQFALELLPSGTALLMSDATLEHPVRAMLLSAVFTVAVLALGLTLFGKKEIK